MAEGGPSRRSRARASASLDIEVVRHGETWSAAPINDGSLRRAAKAAFAMISLPPGSYEATILLTDDAEMRVLNRTWRGKDRATNVLSFPARETVGVPGLLGDVVIAYETTLREAREENIPLEDHVAHLVVHGVLHLAGFDHANDGEAERMEDLERKALASLGIADPYAETQARRPVEVSS